MTRQDRFWRGLGAVLLIGGPSAELLAPEDAQGLRGILTIALLGASLFGIVLLLQGRKVVKVWRIEGRRSHCGRDALQSKLGPYRRDGC
ncbi:hypothetical protein [Novosphingobium sp. ZW T3_23]|uniref:hypothetical protein n=1 Tax=Novosphingobium sp. ZW T3_23 TaxID=3378084 RepID=UPI00385560A1